jgi:CheY-like chemotaxis protein
MDKLSGSRETTAVVADDDEDFRDVLELWLSARSAWDVHAAADGQEALELITPAVDVVVLDREMPNLSGGDVVRALSNDGFDGEIVVVSGNVSDASLPAEDVSRYLTKPVNREQLVDAVDAVLDRPRASRPVAETTADGSKRDGGSAQ